MTADIHSIPTGLSFDEARAIVARIAAKQSLPHERLALPRAHGRVLA